MGADTDGGGCTAPGQQLMRVGYILAGNGSIGDARHHALAFLDQARAQRHLLVTDRVRELTQLVVSELVTNARKYPPGPVWMELRITARIGQHGLEIVKAASEELSIEEEALGNRITARIALSDSLPHR
ncbi:ATP-binding protein [Streptomyces sp. NPDC001046]|uniref:ATP-binding protein n=1 Tax=Streptomyces sp. NPDC001046 TaxID=3364543 RepID=UPI00367DE79D